MVTRGRGGWHGAEFDGDFPTLGWGVIDWIEAHCVQPDGVNAGRPFLLSDEQKRIYLWDYRIDPVTRWDGERWRLPFVFYRGTHVKAPQKWGKGPLSASKIIVECAPDGPVLFDGWDAQGEPVGRPWPLGDPWWQVTATTESQTANIWRSLRPMIELGSLAAEIDTGRDEVHLPGGGLIETVTASAPARRGQRITGAAQDETSDWYESNGGRELADTQRRNLAGTDGRFYETANAFNPARGSVAQGTWEDEEAGVYRYGVDAGPGSIRDPRDLERMVGRAYAGAPWVNQDRIVAEVRTLIKRDPAQAERFFLNRDRASESAAFKDLVAAAVRGDHQPAAGAAISIGVDGARFGDALGVIATELRTGHQWPLGHWERPEAAPDDYEHPFDEVDGAVLEAATEFRLARMYVDPQYIDELLSLWQGRWGPKVVTAWRTNRRKEIGWAIRRYTDALSARDATIADDQTFRRHLENAKKYLLGVFDPETRVELHSLAKDRPGAYIDEAMAGCLSWEARFNAIAAGALEDHEPPPFNPADYRISPL